jgi:hypothetical protein
MRQIGSTAAGPSNAALPVLWLLVVGSGAAALIYEVVWFQLLQLAWLGYFYAGNIAGAVAGSLLAGLYLLRFYDVSVGTYAAVGLNVTVAAIAWLLAGQTAGAPAFDALDTPPIARAPGARIRTVERRCARSRSEPRSRRSRLLDHCDLGSHGAGITGRLDAPALVALRRHGRHLRADSTSAHSSATSGASPPSALDRPA